MFISEAQLEVAVVTENGNISGNFHKCRLPLIIHHWAISPGSILLSPSV
jgi:hypothetical protein